MKKPTIAGLERQVAALQDEVNAHIKNNNALSDKLKDKDNQIANLAADINKMEYRIVAAIRDIANQDGYIMALQAQLNPERRMGERRQNGYDEPSRYDQVASKLHLCNPPIVEKRWWEI